jgi:3-methylfumaryl-CoA hydratase
MFAGGEVVLHSPVVVGSTVRRESSVASVTEKSGRSGPMVVVVVESSLYDEGGALLVEERQDLIYRVAGAPTTETSTISRDIAPIRKPVLRTGPWEAALATDPVTLMRFSAATANAHRIHYDWPYATMVEGYPGLVVHGPFMTLVLAELVRIEQPDTTVRRLTHRNRQPLFCGEPAILRRLGGDNLHHSLALVPGNAAGSGDAPILTSLDVDLAH